MAIVCCASAPGCFLARHLNEADLAGTWQATPDSIARLDPALGVRVSHLSPPTVVLHADGTFQAYAFPGEHGDSRTTCSDSGTWNIVRGVDGGRDLIQLHFGRPGSGACSGFYALAIAVELEGTGLYQYFRDVDIFNHSLYYERISSGSPSAGTAPLAVQTP
jgi:hypothetical protein